MPGFRVYLQQNLTWGEEEEEVTTQEFPLRHQPVPRVQEIPPKRDLCLSQKNDATAATTTKPSRSLSWLKSVPLVTVQWNTMIMKGGGWCKAGGEKRGERKAELVVGGKSRSESESPESFFSCRLHYLMKTRKISHEETSSRTGLGTSEPREGKKFVIFLFFYVDCVDMLSSSFEKLSWQVSVRKKRQKVPLVMCAAARFLKLAWTAADVLINYESIQRPRIFLFFFKIRVCVMSKFISPLTLRKKRRHKFLDLTWQWPLFLLIVIFLSRGGNAGFSFLVVIKTVFPLSLLSVHQKHTHARKLEKCQRLRPEEHVSPK